MGPSDTLVIRNIWEQVAQLWVTPSSDSLLLDTVESTEPSRACDLSS
jgi:hypothetical protein